MWWACLHDLNTLTATFITGKHDSFVTSSKWPCRNPLLHKRLSHLSLFYRFRNFELSSTDEVTRYFFDLYIIIFDERILYFCETLRKLKAYSKGPGSNTHKR